MKNPKYKNAFLYSAIFHVLILGFFIFSIAVFDKTNYVTQSSVMAATLIEIPEPTVKEIKKDKEIAPPKETVQAVPVPPPIKKVEKIETQKTVIEKPKQPAIKIADKKIKPEPTKTPPVKNEIQQKTKEKKLEDKSEKKAALTKSQKLQKNMEEKLWAQSLAEEDKQLSLMKAQQAKGVINKYNALILQAIREQWILTENYSPDLSCQLLINLKTDGTVQEVQLSKSSGNEGFDRSARAAVYKASPLPVPKEADLFNQMKVINLVVRP